ncbi:MAG TPA: PAS domain S-box protein [Bryobacteraceae bacterium]
MPATTASAGASLPAAPEHLLEKITDAFVAIDQDWIVTYVNAEAERLSDLGRHQMLGRNYWQLFPATVGTSFQQELLQVAAHRRAAEFEQYYAPSKRWFQVKADPANNGGVFIFYRDITGRKSVEDALRASEERFRAIVETTPACVGTVAADGTLLHMNEAGLAMLGAMNASEVIGKTIYSLIAPECRDEFRAFNESVCRGERGSLEFDLIGLDGKRRRMETHAAPLSQPDGTVVQLGITHDVSERKRREHAALLLGAIVASSEDAIISKDLKGTIMTWNKSAERLFGYKAEEVLGKPVTILIPPERLSEETDLLSQIARGESIDHFETIRRRKDGSLLNVSLSISPLRDAHGRIIGASKIARDITEVKRAERSALLLAAIVDSSDDAIVSKDLNGMIMTWNKGAERLFGYTADEAVGRPITIVIPPDRLDEEPEILSRIRRGDRMEHFETIRRHKDGSLLDISLTISPVKDGHGNIIGASKIARDISDRKRAEKAIEDLNERLKADLAAMTRLQQLSAKLIESRDSPELLGEILDTAIRLTGAGSGHIQLFRQGVFNIVAQRGLEPALLDFLNSPSGVQEAFGTAAHIRQRVLVTDIASSSLFSGIPGIALMLASGIRAAQSTPLVSRTGQILGTFTTFYGDGRAPAERELRLLDVLARLAADLIERKGAEEALLASEARFRQLADAMPQIVWTARPDGYLDYYNERWYQFTGFGRDQFGDQSWQAIVHPDEVQLCFESWYSSVRSGEPFRIEFRLWDRREARWRWFMSRALPVRDTSGATVKWFGTSTDIDEQKRIEQELRRANLDLEQFAYSASHDLQEPLRTIKIYGELLAQRYGGSLDGEAFEFVEYLRTGASRMEELVRDLLNYTQITLLEPPTLPVDANEALASALANLAGAIAESEATVANDPLPPVRAHSTHLRQLFQNLIGNAIKYRSPDRPPIVTVTAAQRDGQCIFSVQDNGIGIAPEYRGLIFGLFKRLHTTHEYSGTGIGLAICQRIVERYRGRIWVESQLGCGSKFTFEIPA